MSRYYGNSISVTPRLRDSSVCHPVFILRLEEWCFAVIWWLCRAQQGILDPFWVAGAAFTGGYLGDELRFFLARKYGERLTDNRPRLTSWLGKAKLMLEHHGTAYIFLYRYPKGMRTIGAFPVGLTSMGWSTFTALNAASALVWVVILVGSGYVFGSAIDKAVSNNWGVVSIVMLGVFILLTLFAWRRLTHVGQVKP